MNKFIKRLIVLSVMLLKASSSIGVIAKNSVRILLILMGVTWSTLALAEGGCPEGQFPQQYGTTMGCTTMNAGGNQPLAPVWADRWGAIAFDGSNGTVGVAADTLSMKKAQKVAIQDCQKRGGRGCSIKTTYHNQCAVVVTGDGDANFLNAPTIEQATKTGMDSCRARNDTNCRVYYSGCSMPVRVN